MKKMDKFLRVSLAVIATLAVILGVGLWRQNERVKSGDLVILN